MSRIEDLIAELCPEGVEYKAIGDFGELVRGNGMPKSDFVESGVGCIHYGQIYTHYGIWAMETKSFVSAEKAERLAKVEHGDLVITNTSENMEDVCKAVAWLGESQIVTGGHATVLKHGQDSKYLSYYLQTPTFFAAKKKHATGTKVIDVSAKSLAKIRIPLPPLEVQREIVKILDAFTELGAELEAELVARQQQYQYYRDDLLSFDGREDVRRVTLGEVCRFINGRAYKQQELLEKGKYPVLRVGNFFTNSNWYFSDLELEDDKYCDSGDLLYAWSASFGPKIWGEGKAIYHYHIWKVVPNVDLILKKYLFHLLMWDTEALKSEFGTGSTMMHVGKGSIEKRLVPVPSIAEQTRIVEILDKFDALVNDISSGLPAEIAARRQQYAYYRDKLLSFKEAA